MQATMRFLLIGLALAWGGVASAAVEDAKVAASKRASEAFVQRVQALGAGASLPRRSDPAIAALLDAAFDITALGPGILPLADSGKAGELLNSANRIGIAYLLAGTGATDFSTTDPKVLAKSDENVVAYAPEVGQWMDFQIGIQAAFVASTLQFLSTATPATLERPNVKSGLANVRQGVARTISGALQTMALTGLDGAWRQARLTVMEESVVGSASIVTAEDAAAIRSLAQAVAARMTDAGVQARLRAYAERFAAAKP